jgi:hypothetical protein
MFIGGGANPSPACAILDPTSTTSTGFWEVPPPAEVECVFFFFFHLLVAKNL